MNICLLLIGSIFLLQHANAFLRNQKRMTRNKLESKSRLASLHLLSPEEDDPNRKRKINAISHPNPFSDFQPRQDPNDPLYTVFWKKCPECTTLLEEMEARGLRVVFIDGQAIFDIIWDEPLVYKNEELLTEWFSGNQGSPFVSPPPPFR